MVGLAVVAVESAMYPSLRGRGMSRYVETEKITRKKRIDPKLKAAG
ncbi:MAG: hypothetical protein WBN93_05500 [Acidimicrobiia bacterium]